MFEWVAGSIRLDRMGDFHETHKRLSERLRRGKGRRG